MATAKSPARAAATTGATRRSARPYVRAAGIGAADAPEDIWDANRPAGRAPLASGPTQSRAAGDVGLPNRGGRFRPRRGGGGGRARPTRQGMNTTPHGGPRDGHPITTHAALAADAPAASGADDEIDPGGRSRPLILAIVVAVLALVASIARADAAPPSNVGQDEFFV